MKKITKTFYVRTEHLNKLQSNHNAEIFLYSSELDHPVPGNSIEITFSVPEKKIEITEGQLFDMFKHDNDEFVYSYDQVKQKLFGESHD